jgi:hypothetical protein
MKIPDFNEFMRGEQSPVEKMLVQALAVITVQPAFHHMTPEDVYEMLVEQTEEIAAQVEA